MKKLMVFTLLLFQAGAGHVFELTKEDPFQHPGVKGLQISFFGVKVGDVAKMARDKIPGFVSDIKSQKRLMFKDAFVDYDDDGRIIRIAIGRSFARYMKGKTKKLFDPDILENADKRYDVLQPEKENVKVRETVMDKIKIEQYIFAYPGRHFSLYGSKRGGKINFNYFVLEK